MSNESWLDRARAKVQRLAAERDTPPSPAACAIADEVLAACFAIDLKPSRIVPHAGGGVSVYFFRDGRRAHVSIDNDEENDPPSPAPVYACEIEGRVPHIYMGAISAEVPRLAVWLDE
jgi:hypothetical protein